MSRYYNTCAGAVSRLCQCRIKSYAHQAAKACGPQTARYAAPLIFLVFCVSLAPWLYDFPLNDDWAYAIGVKNLLEQGRFVLCDWAASTQLPHILGGALFAKIFGFSFTALKACNLAFSAALVFVFFKILEEFDIDPADRLLAALAFCLNPLFLVLANSFMTDITYLFWMLLASWFYIRHLKAGNPAALISAGLCAAAACLTRQLGIALPLAYTLTLAWERKLNLKNTLNIWLFPLIALLGYALWFKYVHGPTWASGNYVFTATLKYLSAPGAFASTTLYRIFAAMMETGLILLPLAAGYYLSAGRLQFNARPDAVLKTYGRQKAKTAERRRAAKSWGILLTLAALACFILINGPLPYLENTFSKSGLGVLTLGGSRFKPSAFFSSGLFWYALTALAAFSAAILLRASNLSLRAGDAAVKFVFANALIHLGISLAGAKFFDRYLLTLLPWFILAAACTARSVKFSRPAAVLVLVLMAAVGWAGVKDYLQWNRAKWELASRPRPDIRPDKIANGFDYDAWHNYEKNMTYLKTMKPLKMIGEWEWQKITDYKALVSFSPQPGFTAIDRIEYSTPLSSRKGVLYLLSLQKAQPRLPL
ncbi:MAG: glycosyltransferase family 39 protein [Elusimicrobia bacterium]|nr:glycosyltransferase family 39 protein [Elusimicrobiota bacterium]